MVLEGTLPKYIEFKTFELFRDRLYGLIVPYSRPGSKVDIYKQLFLCPANLSKKHNFKLHGVLSPYICLWRTSPLMWNTSNKLYARSVLPRKILYNTKDGETRAEEGYFYDLNTTFDLYCSSYYRDFCDRVNQDLIDLDRQRFFIYNLKELFQDATSIRTTVELSLEGLAFKEDLDDKQVRSFSLAAKYRLKITVPYSRHTDFLRRVEVYLQQNKIYEKELIDEKDSTSTGE